MELILLLGGPALLLALAGGAGQYAVLRFSLPKKALWAPPLLPLLFAAAAGFLYYRSTVASGMFFAGLAELIYSLWALGGTAGTLLITAVWWFRARKK